MSEKLMKLNEIAESLDLDVDFLITQRAVCCDVNELIPDSREGWKDIAETLAFFISAEDDVYSNVQGYAKPDIHIQNENYNSVDCSYLKSLDVDYLKILTDRYKSLKDEDKNDSIEKYNIELMFAKAARNLFPAYLEIMKIKYPNTNYTKYTQSENNFSKADKEKTEFVYVAKQLNETDIYKIGKTKDIEQRLSTFKTGNCYVEMIMTKQSNNASKLESFLHKYYQNKNYQREWFKLNAEDLSELVDVFGFNPNLINSKELV